MARRPIQTGQMVQVSTNSAERPAGAIACKPWEFGDERRGRVGVPCTTPRCTRHLAVTAPKTLDAIYICGHALAGYCEAMFERPHPEQDRAA